MLTFAPEIKIRVKKRHQKRLLKKGLEKETRNLNQDL